MTTTSSDERKTQPRRFSAGSSAFRTSTDTAKTEAPKPRSRLRSTGCKTCRQRKIKCDEQKPTCKNCNKSHRTCLGYNNVQSYVFTEDQERHDSRSHDGSSFELSYGPTQPIYADGSVIRRESTYSMTSDEQSLPFDNHMFEPTQPVMTYDMGPQRSGTSQSTDVHATESIMMSPREATEQNLEAFFFRRFITNVWLHSQVDAWQYYLPLALRSSPALYYSVMSLSALYMSQIEAQPRAREYALGLYQGTLAQLQKAIYDPGTALRDETMMATIIVGLYELIDKPDLLSWTSHSRGTAQLMKMRGSHSVRSGMGKMLFLTFRGYEVVRAILQCEETFIADAIWTIESSSAQTIRASQGLLHATPETKESPMQSGPDYAAVLFMLGGQVANFQAACARTARQITPSPHAHDALLEQARRLEQDLQQWRASLPPAYRLSDFTPPLDLGAYTVGYQLSFYAAFLMLVHRVVAKYLYRDMSRLHHDCESLARGVLVQAQYLTQTVTSVNLNVTWPIYMASIHLSRPEEKAQAMALLRSISREKGWRVADSALSAASLAAQKSRLRDAQAQTRFYEHQR